MHMTCNLREFKEFIDNEMILILGQMDSPTEIFDHVFLVGPAASTKVGVFLHQSPRGKKHPDHKSINKNLVNCEIVMFNLKCDKFSLGLLFGLECTMAVRHALQRDLSIMKRALNYCFSFLKGSEWNASNMEELQKSG